MFFWGLTLFFLGVYMVEGFIVLGVYGLITGFWFGCLWCLVE